MTHVIYLKLSYRYDIGIYPYQSMSHKNSHVLPHKVPKGHVRKQNYQQHCQTIVTI